MIKQTLYFGNPCYLSLKNKQLVIQFPTDETIKKETTRSIEDIGLIMLDNPQITMTHQVIKALQANNAGIISCDDQHMPHSLLLPLEGHSLQSKRYKFQIEATIPLKKNLWQQTIEAKVTNQIKVLQKLGKPSKRLEVMHKKILSGDPANIEARAAAFYWPTLFDGFTRDRYGDAPNSLLNYGYSIIRSMVARALVGSGLIPTLGIHHSNQYNAFCLADDIMEPARPFIDLIVYDLYIHKKVESFLQKESKQALLSVMTADGMFGKKKSPLMVGYGITAASLAACYKGERRKVKFPLMI